MGGPCRRPAGVARTGATGAVVLRPCPRAPCAGSIFRSVRDEETVRAGYFPPLFVLMTPPPPLFLIFSLSLILSLPHSLSHSLSYPPPSPSAPCLLSIPASRRVFVRVCVAPQASTASTAVQACHRHLCLVGLIIRHVAGPVNEASPGPSMKRRRARQ